MTVFALGALALVVDAISALYIKVTRARMLRETVLAAVEGRIDPVAADLLIRAQAANEAVANDRASGATLQALTSTPKGRLQPRR
ncbi:hypothetical protein Hesp01_07710 [Herbidospora sp. NBRC 101105]|nr:hypothetical protein Hesp01_07710 [Herbidospora sp. NBRC 101105]